MRMNLHGSGFKKFLDKLSARDWFFVVIGLLVITALILTVVLQPKKDPASSPGLNAIKSRGVVRVGVLTDLPNFAYKGEDGQMSGMEVDIARAIAARVFGGDNTKVELVPVSLNTRIAKLEKKLVDCTISAIPEGINSKADYSTPYYWDAVGMLVRADDSASSLKGLSAKRIGVVSRPSIATTAFTTRKALEQYAKDNHLTFEIVDYAAIPDMLDALSFRKIDGAVLEYALMQAYYTKDFKVLPEAVATVSYCVAVKAKDEAMLAIANDVIDKLLVSGELKNIWTKWGLNDYR